MSTRYYALILGIIFAVIGVAGLIPGLLTPLEDPDLAADTLAGRLFGIFPVNLWHSLVHLAFGIWGIAAYRRWSASRTYSKTVAIAYAVLTILGFIPGLATFFGLVPLYGNDIWLHALIAISAAYFGWGARAPAEDRATTTGYYR